MMYFVARQVHPIVRIPCSVSQKRNRSYLPLNSRGPAEHQYVSTEGTLGPK